MHFFTGSNTYYIMSQTRVNSLGNICYFYRRYFRNKNFSAVHSLEPLEYEIYPLL